MTEKEFKKITELLDDKITLYQAIGEPFGKDLDIAIKLSVAYEKLQQENKKLNGAIQTYDILLKSNVEENKKLKDNWNKLKEYCKENTLCYEVGDDENTKLIGSKIHGLNVLDKMQELERSDSNE